MNTVTSRYCKTVRNRRFMCLCYSALRPRSHYFLAWNESAVPICPGTEVDFKLCTVPTVAIYLTSAVLLEAVQSQRKTDMSMESQKIARCKRRRETEAMARSCRREKLCDGSARKSCMRPLRSLPCPEDQSSTERSSKLSALSLSLSLSMSSLTT